jgi:hypothetical protein
MGNYIMLLSMLTVHLAYLILELGLEYGPFKWVYSDSVTGWCSSNANQLTGDQYEKADVCIMSASTHRSH